jgi:hypothetical protein
MKRAKRREGGRNWKERIEEGEDSRGDELGMENNMNKRKGRAKEGEKEVREKEVRR